MTVKELKAALADIPDDYPVFMSADPEGNSYGQLRAVDLGRTYTEEYRPEHMYLIDTELTGELEDHGYTDEDLRPDLPPVVCLWP